MNHSPTIRHVPASCSQPSPSTTLLNLLMKLGTKDALAACWDVGESKSCLVVEDHGCLASAWPILWMERWKNYWTCMNVFTQARANKFAKPLSVTALLQENILNRKDCFNGQDSKIITIHRSREQRVANTCERGVLQGGEAREHHSTDSALAIEFNGCCI